MLEQAVKSQFLVDSVGSAVGDAGNACKACHDEYKSKNYLY